MTKYTFLQNNYEIINSNYDYLLKIMIIGNSGVGKSSMMLRYTDDVYVKQAIPTIGVDFRIRTIEYKKKIYKLQIWDTAGQERFKTITTSYYKGAQGIIIVYDVSDEESFNNLDKWINECKKFANHNVKIILAANKTDIHESKHKITTQMGMDFAKIHGYKFVETSAKNNNGIDNVFKEMIVEITGNNNSNLKKKPDQTFMITPGNSSKTYNMCC